ncbi:MAG: dihydrofolate reductase family protein [Myxacorys chilensis ATA2-1-KO14]|jgi:dihydrofolate reductase|nr:dihydrofolate reductase family protein [Myxacorys chilensis ATA2-1-KO14]
MENDAKFILYLATTLDGYIASSDGSIEWLTSFETNGEDNGYIAFYETIDALVMGSATYEQVVGFGDWPYPDKLSYVLTNRNLSTNRNDVVFVSDVKAILEDVKRKGSKRIWIVGGGKVASLFMVQGLIDEHILTLIPIILGAGISLYQAVPEQKLNLVKTTSYASGAVELRYKKR